MVERPLDLEIIFFYSELLKLKNLQLRKSLNICDAVGSVQVLKFVNLKRFFAADTLITGRNSDGGVVANGNHSHLFPMQSVTSNAFISGAMSAPTRIERGYGGRERTEVRGGGDRF